MRVDKTNRSTYGRGLELSREGTIHFFGVSDILFMDQERRRVKDYNVVDKYELEEEKKKKRITPCQIYVILSEKIHISIKILKIVYVYEYNGVGVRFIRCQGSGGFFERVQVDVSWGKGWESWTFGD